MHPGNEICVQGRVLVHSRDRYLEPSRHPSRTAPCNTLSTIPSTSSQVPANNSKASKSTQHPSAALPPSRASALPPGNLLPHLHIWHSGLSRLRPPPNLNLAPTSTPTTNRQPAKRPDLQLCVDAIPIGPRGRSLHQFITSFSFESFPHVSTRPYVIVGWLPSYATALVGSHGASLLLQPYWTLTFPPAADGTNSHCTEYRFIVLHETLRQESNSMMRLAS